MHIAWYGFYISPQVSADSLSWLLFDPWLLTVTVLRSKLQRLVSTGVSDGTAGGVSEGLLISRRDFFKELRGVLVALTTDPKTASEDTNMGQLRSLQPRSPTRAYLYLLSNVLLRPHSPFLRAI